MRQRAQNSATFGFCRARRQWRERVFDPVAQFRFSAHLYGQSFRVRLLAQELTSSVVAAAPTILLAWNPRKWPWDDFAEQQNTVREHGSADDRWGCGNRKRIPVGTRFFLIRLGVPPKGIIASGWTISPPYESEEEWDTERSARTRPYHLVDITFDKLFVEPPIPLAALQRASFSSFHWAIQMSGVLIPSLVAAALERAWKRRCDAIS